MRDKLVNNINSIRVQPLPDDLDNIVFLGHSLGHADYSYFESLFDRLKTINCI